MPFALPGVSDSRRSLLIATCCLLCALLATAACGDGRASRVQTPAGKTMPRSQFPMPPATATSAEGADRSSQNNFTLLDNSRRHIADYAGQVVLLDFYATWCQPCREETPHLVELHKRYASQGLQIIGLNVGGQEDRDKVPGYASEFQIPYALAYPDAEMARLYLSDDERIPQAFVFDRFGNLVKRFRGYDAAMAAELERVIQEQLAVRGGSN